MSMRFRVSLLVVQALCFSGSRLLAAEPNNTFEQATVLASSIRSVDDDVTVGTLSGPDTFLGTLGFFDEVEFTDDDGSIYGDGYASGVTGMPVNPGGTIDFLVTGCCDGTFSGDHVYAGEFEVFVDVFDFFGDHVETVSELRTLQPGVVEEFHLVGDETWLDGTYDVNIDNLVGGAAGSDVDFYTFTGLTSGAPFAAEVTQQTLDGFDSILGWFDDDGFVVETDDDSGVNSLSLVEGIVPTSGKLTFAVTGYDDFDFIGVHEEDADYTLKLTVGKKGDFDNDSDVDGRDFLLWQRNHSVGSLSDWKANFGAASQPVSASVPEPASALLSAMLAIAVVARKRTTVGRNRAPAATA